MNSTYTIKMNALLGALVGDAAGATLEFYTGGELTQEVVERAMQMPGGGSLRVGAGQITDDGELTLTLWRALLQADEADPVPYLIKGYAAWYESIPFDIGRTCSLAFDYFASECMDRMEGPTLHEMEEVVWTTNRGSEANGALMRATAIPTWTVQKGLTADDAVTLARQDARLSHPCVVCQETNAIYVYAIHHLLQGATPADVLAKTESYVEKTITSHQVKQWFEEESLDISDMNARHQMGHVRWGFVMAIYFLRHPAISYEDAIRTTLLKGGDTDTNAAIVGGMVGAYQPIPPWMLHPVLIFDSTACSSREGRIRCKEYCPKYVL